MLWGMRMRKSIRSAHFFVRSDSQSADSDQTNCPTLCVRVVAKKIYLSLKRITLVWARTFLFMAILIILVGYSSSE